MDQWSTRTKAWRGKWASVPLFFCGKLLDQVAALSARLKSKVQQSCNRFLGHINSLSAAKWEIFKIIKYFWEDSLRIFCLLFFKLSSSMSKASFLVTSTPKEHTGGWDSISNHVEVKKYFYLTRWKISAIAWFSDKKKAKFLRLSHIFFCSMYRKTL